VKNATLGEFMVNQNKLFILIITIILFSFFPTCKKVFETDFNQPNCDNLTDGLINLDSKMLCSEISKLMSDLHPSTSSDDKFGHRENLNLLIERINNSCENVSAELLCYACIETLPPQSEIKLSTDSSGVEIGRILDILTPEDNVLSCIRLHKGYF
jgi:hypothetical protein